MSRCYPFPPPGYIKNAPVVIELPEKKEKRKHKDKKKKTKKHSAKDGESTQQENLTEGTVNTVAASDQTKVVSSLAAHESAKERLQAGSSGKDVSIITKEVVSSAMPVNQRWHTASPGKEATLHAVTATNKEKLPKIDASVKGVPNGGTIDHGKLHASSARANGGLSNGGITIDLQRVEQGLQADDRRDEVLRSNKRPRLQEENLKRLLPSNTKCEMPQQRLQGDVARNRVGTISAQVENKHKSLQQDSTLTINGNRPEQRVQKGGPGHAALNKTTNSERLQAQRPAVNGVQGLPAGHAVLSNGKDAKKMQADRKYSSQVLSRGAQAAEAAGTVGPAKSGRTEHTLQGDGARYGMLSKGLQVANSERPLHRLKVENIGREDLSNDLPAATKRTRIKADMEAGNLSHVVPPTKQNKSQASNTTSQLLLNQVLPPNCEHRVQGAYSKRGSLSNGMEAKKESLMNGGQLADIERPEANIVDEKMLLNSVHAASGGQSSRQAALKADSPLEKVLPNGIQKAKLPADGCREKRSKQILQAVNIANGLPIDCNGEVSKPSSSKIDASDRNGVAGKDLALTCRLSSESDYTPSRQYLAQYMPHIQNIIPTMDDEDWPFSSVRQAQPKSTEREESQVPQVWAEARLLKSVGIHALPYVVAD